MIVLRANIELMGGYEALRKRTPRIVKEALAEAAAYWHKKFAPRHFRSGAATRYGYTPRSENWRRRKRRVKGHALPLVWTGRTKRQVTRAARLTGTSRAITLNMHVERYIFYRKHSARGEINMAAEITRIISPEKREIRRHMDRVLERGLSGVTDREVIRI